MTVEKQNTTVSDAALRCFTGYNLKRAFNAVQSDLNRTLELFGLRMMTFSTLAMVAENSGLRPSQLAEALSIDRANTVVYVDQLVAAGWVTRSQSKEDRRAHALICTPSGQRMYNEARRAVLGHDKRMFGTLDQNDFEVVKRALSAIETQGHAM